jgi:glycosyltransferase involved in cell wall biosynthesis
MNILFIGDVCGIASLNRTCLKRLYGIDCIVVQRSRYDLGDVSRFYKAIMMGSSRSFKLYCLSQSFFHDIIHIHAYDTLARWSKWLTRKPVILQYHGTDIRGRKDEKRRYHRFADRIIVSTPDLLEEIPEATYLPNPVDTELFRPLTVHDDNSALYYVKGDWKLGEDPSFPFDMARKYGLKLHLLHRSVCTIPYEEMPIFLNQFGWFIDRNYVKSLSRTALEALSCGLKVINWKGEVIYPPLPDEHKPEFSAKKLMKIYEDLLKK